ncbi:10214_t:CDS:2, partial [Funneliformis geosporum]
IHSFDGTTSVQNTPFTRYQFDGFISNNENLSSRVQALNSPPLFYNNAASFNDSLSQSFLDH